MLLNTDLAIYYEKRIEKGKMMYFEIIEDRKTKHSLSYVSFLC